MFTSTPTPTTLTLRVVATTAIAWRSCRIMSRSYRCITHFGATVCSHHVHHLCVPCLHSLSMHVSGRHGIEECEAQRVFDADGWLPREPLRKLKSAYIDVRVEHFARKTRV